MSATIFGTKVDLMNVAKIVAVVASVFSLNNVQEKQITNYIKLNNMQWIEKRKRDSEIEASILAKVQEIK